MTIIYLNLTLNICSLLLMMITLYGVLFVESKKSTRNTLFKYIVGLLLFCLVIDTSSYFYVFTDPGGPGWYITSFVAAIPPFIWVVLIMFYLISFIRERKPISWNTGWVFAIVVGLIIILGSLYALRGEAFSWEDDHFQPGFMGPIVFFSELIILLYYGFMIIYYRSVLGLHNSIALFSFLLIPMIGLTLDALIPGLYSILFGMAVSVQICFILVQHHELNIARQNAESASLAKSLFLNNMSHDIRTPMNAILGFTQLMEHQADDPVAVRNYLAKIKKSSSYLLTLINEVLDMARIESGKAEVEEGFYDLLDPKNNLLPLFEETIRQKNLTVKSRHRIEHRYVMLDKTKVQQITINLISNAVKYTPEGGHIFIDLEEVPSERAGYANYIFRIQDDGIGMSKEFAQHVFDQFSRARNTTQSKIIGTGLGMSIVKKLVELMGGTIKVNSELGKGSIFAVTNPHRIVTNPEVYLNAEKEVKKQQPKVSLAGKRVLLAEDNEINAEIATLMLQREGVEVEHAEDGLQCVEMLTDKPSGYYDFILMDIQMPRLNGYDATRRIRTMSDLSKATIPIVAVTANAFDEDQKEALRAGMNGHIAKPIVTEKLIQLIGKLLK